MTARWPAAKAELNTPWDVLAHDGLIYIAMAGQHQLWLYDPAKKEIRHFAGSGAEGIDDGELMDASFAQSSGLTTDGATLYVADPEASAVRAVDFSGTLARCEDPGRHGALRLRRRGRQRR